MKKEPFLKNLTHQIKRSYQRMLIKSRKKMIIDTSSPKGENEDEVVSICRTLVRNKKSELLLCPKTFDRYIINSVLETYIIINEDYVDIVHNTHHYNIPICKKTHITLVNIFDGNAELRRKQLKNKIFATVNVSLNSIYQTVKNQ